MRNTASITIFGALLATTVGCGSGDTRAPLASLSVESTSPGENSAPVIRDLRIDPQHPSLDDPLRAVASVFDPDGDPVEIEYTWWVDGIQLAARSADPDPTQLDLSVGSSVRVAAIASDGRQRSDSVRSEVEVINRAPRLTSLGMTPPQRVYPGDPILVTPSGEDPDGDIVTFQFEWFVNDEPSLHEDPEFPTTGLKQGDRVRVSVSASDGADESSAMESVDVVVTGAHPEITSVPPGGSPGSVYRYEVAAVDPDGDKRLRFRLSEGPAGMTVDSLSGVVEWTPKLRQSGSHKVSVAVVDSSGLETTQTFEVSVTEDAPPAAAE